VSAIAIQKPIAQTPGSANGLPPMLSLPVSSHCNDADFVTETSGTIAPAGANPTLIAGIVQHDSNANYGGQLPPPAAYSLNQVFGVSQQNASAGNPSPGFDPSPGYTITATLKNPVIVEMNLTASTGWVTGGTQQANLGTRIGLAIDAGTGFYVADPTASNKIGTVTGKPELPGPGGPFGASPGTNGDTGARVLVVFDDSATQLQGH